MKDALLRALYKVWFPFVMVASVILLISFFPGKPNTTIYELKQIEWELNQGCTLHYRLYLSNDNIANAYTFLPVSQYEVLKDIPGIQPDAWPVDIILTKRLLAITSPKGIAYVLAHEKGHGHDWLRHKSESYWFNDSAMASAYREIFADMESLRALKFAGMDYTVGTKTLRYIIAADKGHEYPESILREQIMDIYVKSHLTLWEKIKFRVMR